MKDAVGMLFVGAFLGVFLLVGVVVLGMGWRSWQQNQQVQHWSTTTGELLHHELETRTGKSTTYRLQVRYRYRVGGQDFESSRFAFGYEGSMGGLENYQQIIQKLDQGRRVRVYYDSQHPDQAVLSHGLNRGSLVLLVFGSIWTVFTVGLGTLLWMTRGVDQAILRHLQVF